MALELALALARRDLAVRRDARLDVPKREALSYVSVSRAIHAARRGHRAQRVVGWVGLDARRRRGVHVHAFTAEVMIAVFAGKTNFLMDGTTARVGCDAAW